MRYAREEIIAGSKPTIEIFRKAKTKFEMAVNPKTKHKPPRTYVQTLSVSKSLEYYSEGKKVYIPCDVPMYVQPLVWGAGSNIELTQRPDNFFILRWVTVN